MNIVVIFAGGVGCRMNSKVLPKQFLLMHGKPIIIHTLEKFDRHSEIDGIVISCIESWMGHLEELVRQYNLQKVMSIVSGGQTGQLSIYNGLLAAENVSHGKRAIVLIHDGVRPLVDEKLIHDNIENVKRYGSAITCVKVSETVLLLEEADENSIRHIPDRKNARLARAPQSFWLEDILAAHRKALEDEVYDFIDSCSLMQAYGRKMFLVEGNLENIKITTPDDFYIMRALLDAREDSQIYGLPD